MPYDFDATGVVNAPYARPIQSLQIRSVRQRLYRGRCRPQPELDATLAAFRNARANIFALFRNDVRLSPEAIDKTTGYLDAFYAIIDDPEELKEKVVAHCSGGV